MLVRQAGAGQVIVVYHSDDDKRTKGEGLSGDLVVRVAEDAAERDAEGWSIVAYDSTILGSYGFSAASAEPKSVAITVVYRKRPDA